MKNRQSVLILMMPLSTLHLVIQIKSASTVS
jgi:hypothetical protein